MVLDNIKAPIYEVFFSYQGEGPFTGMPQIFIRFKGCNLSCNYCDSPKSQGLKSNDKMTTVGTLIKKVEALYKKNKDKFLQGPPSISLTGGEPLLWADFLKSFLPPIKKVGFSVYLESNGVLCDNLKKILSFCDVVSMDFKLKSACNKDLQGVHKRFLKMASKKNVFVKCVITKDTKDIEIIESAKIIKSVSKDIQLILQPSITVKRPPIQNLFRFKSLAADIIPNVVIMAQLHKVYKIR
jgi:organic radical activating enzyme